MLLSREEGLGKVEGGSWRLIVMGLGRAERSVALGCKILQWIHMFLAVVASRAHKTYRVRGRPGPGLACL